MNRLKCSHCGMSWTDEGEEFPTCHADRRWPAPCELEDAEDSNEEEYDDE